MQNEFSIITQVSSFLINIISHITIILFSKLKIKFANKKLYYNDLYCDLNKMPFIYHDLEGDVLNDFVDIDANRMNITTLQALNETSFISYQVRLKENNKAVFLGNAGIGKTTFFRYVILNLIKNRNDIPIFSKRERKKIIPIYIPLKIIDNNSLNPIYKYIINNIRPFKGRSGERYLIKKAHKSEIFLLLDGYDEISQINKINYIQAELSQLFNDGKTIDGITVRTIFHENMQRSKMWLSSRKEFFRINGFGNFHPNTSMIYSHRIIGLELKGIGDNRLKLAKTIFDRYKARNSKYIELLDEEYFIRSLNNSGGIDLDDMTQSPLFLTVIIYIYISEIQINSNIETFIDNNYVTLVLKSIELLLKDLDEEKVRYLPKVKKYAHLQRRNLYEKEKFDFLKYFAAQLYIEKLTVFNYEYVIEKTKNFFTHYNTNFKSQIINGLTERGNDPNFVEQIIYCNLFTFTGRNDNIEVFDFPHRRFREVLAAKYFEENLNYDFIFNLLSCQEDYDYSEFIYVFFRITKEKDRLLNKMLQEYLKIKDPLYRNLALNCIITTSSLYDPSRVIESFIINIIDKNTIIELPKDFIRRIIPDKNFISLITSKVADLLQSKNYYALKFIFSTFIELDISYFNKTEIIQKIQPISDDLIALIVIDYFMNNSKSIDIFYENFVELQKHDLFIIISKNLRLINAYDFESWLSVNSMQVELLRLIKNIIHFKCPIEKEFFYLADVHYFFDILLEKKEDLNADLPILIASILTKVFKFDKKPLPSYIDNRINIVQNLLGVHLNKKIIDKLYKQNLGDPKISIMISDFKINHDTLQRNLSFFSKITCESINKYKCLFHDFYIEM